MSGQDGGAAAPTFGGKAHLEGRILATLSGYAVMQAVLAATALVRNKIVAVRLGPSPFGELAQMAAVVGVATTLVSFGMQVSLSRNTARAETAEERQRQLANANGLVAVLAVVAIAALGALLASGRLLDVSAIAHTPTTVLATALLVAAIPLEALKNNYQSVLSGILDVKGMALGRSVAVLVATALAVPLVWYYGLAGAALQYLLLSGLVALLLGRRCRVMGFRPLQLRLEPRVVAVLASFGAVSVVSGFAQALSDAAVRGALIHGAGAAANGLLQADTVLSNTLKGIVLTSVGSVSLAAFSARSARADVAASIGRMLDVVVPVAAAALGLLGLLGVPVLTVLYSEAFAPAAALLPWLLAADLVMVLVRVLASPLLAWGDRLVWLGLDLLYAAAKWALALVLLPAFGPVAVVAAYFAAVALQAAANVAVLRARHGVTVPARQLLRLGTGVALVASLAAVGARDVPAATAAGFAVWLGWTVHHARRTGVLEAVRRRLRRR